MNVDPANLGGRGSIERVKNILLKPKEEWARIAAEPVDVPRLYVGYVLPLAALGALAFFIGYSLIGYSGFGIAYRVPLVAGAIGAALQTIAYAGAIYVIAVVANALAPSFGSTQNQGQAHKLVAYSFTAALLAGVFAILPAVAALSLVGLYSLYLLYVGLPVMMNTPGDRRTGYFIALLAVGIVVFAITGVVLGDIRGNLSGFGPGLTLR